MPRVPHSLLPAALTALLLAGCGAASSPDSAADRAPRAAAPAQTARVAAGGVTDGRTGDAVTGASGRGLRQLSTGGRPDPSDRPRSGGRRDGVGAGDACPETDLQPAAGNLDRVEASTLCLLNGERADRGLRPLTGNGRLAEAARRHAADMVARSYFAHEGLDGSDVRSRIEATGYIPTSGRWVIGENLAWGTGALATPKAIVNAWMNSAGHRANVLHADYREIGFGVVAGNPARPTGLGGTYATTFGVTGDADADTPEAEDEVVEEDATPAAGARSGTKPASTRSSTRRAATRRAAAKRLKRSCAARARATVSRQGGSARTASRKAKKLQRACLARAKRASRNRAA